MLVSSTTTCPNPALLGHKFLEMTPIKPTHRSTRKPSLNSLITNSIIGFGLYFVSNVVRGGLFLAREHYLVNKIASIDFPLGSEGEFLRDRAVEIIRNHGLWLSFTSPLPHQAYAFLTAPSLQLSMNRPHLPQSGMTNLVWNSMLSMTAPAA